MSSVEALGVRSGVLRAVAVVMWLLVAAFVAACAVTPHHGFVVWRDGALSWATQAVPAVYCWMSLARDGAERRAERILMASAITSFAAGDAVLLWLLSNHQQPPVPSPADFGYILFYPLAAASVVLGVRRQRLFRSRVTWFDTAAGALAGATVVAAGLGDTFRLPGGGTAASVITGFFPSFDVCFVALIAAVAAAQAFRLRACWLLLSLGFLVFTAADVVFARMLVAGDYTVGSLLDPSWSVGLSLMALWCAAAPGRLARRAEEPADLAVPLVAVAVGCAVLVGAASGWDLPPVAIAFAVGTILATALKSVWIRVSGLERVHELTLQRSRLLDRLVDAQEAERARMAADVHDEPVQALAAMSIRLGLLQRKVNRVAPELTEEVQQLQQMATDAVGGLRAVLLDLEPVSETVELVPMLNDTLATLFDDTTTSYRLDVEELPPLHATELTKATRITREALRNVRQHARASEVVVRARAVDGGLEISVTDDGVGIAPETWTSPPGHRGISTMRDRATVAGGWCRLERPPGGGSGAVVRFWLPTPALPGDGTTSLPALLSERSVGGQQP
jgi:signal transduction histidine kinase